MERSSPGQCHEQSFFDFGSDLNADADNATPLQSNRNCISLTELLKSLTSLQMLWLTTSLLHEVFPLQ